MFKLGISEEKDLRPSALTGFFNSRKFVALDLYNLAEKLPLRDRDTTQERILSRFAVDNKAYKYTHANRFDDFDEISLKIIADTFPKDRQESIRVHDIGVSDGRTSCSFFDRLIAVYDRQLDFVASDYAPYLYVLRDRKQAHRRVVVDHQGNLLQIITPPFVFNIIHQESVLLYPLNHLIRRLVTASFANPLVEANKNGHPLVEPVRIELICQEYRDRMARHTNCRFRQYDMMAAVTEPFSMIRAMNILNVSYFSEAQLRTAATNIAGSLEEGGLFITGSNLERGTTVNGGIYRKSGGRMVQILSSGSGSQADALITSI